MPVKVLLSGPVRGNIDVLLKRVKSAHAKAGPFSGVICVGQFFEDGDAGAECPTWFRECVEGNKEFPIPVYFVGGDGVSLNLLAHAALAHVQH